MTAINPLRLLLPAILIFLTACSSKKPESTTEPLLLSKKAVFYEQFIFADNENLDTLLYFKIDLNTRKWYFNAHKDIAIGVQLSTEEHKEKGYPNSIFVLYDYVRNVWKKSDTLIRTSAAKPQSLSVHLDKDGRSMNIPKTTEVITYRSYRATDPGLNVSFSQYFNIEDSVHYKGLKNVFANLGMMDNIMLNLNDDLKKCVPKTKRAVMRTILSDSEDVMILRRTYPL